LQERLKEGTDLLVINLDVPDSTLVKRIEGRLLCKGCDAIYNRYFSPSKKEGICDRCGSELYHRVDDSADVVVERLMVYQRQTMPIIEFYRLQGVLHTVNGEGDSNLVFEQLKNLCKK
jgi:adenylate kinase